MSLQIAVIGAGHLGRIHARLLPQVEGAELLAVADPHESARQQLEANQPIRTTSDWRTLVDEIDGAIIATPTEFHYEIAHALIDQGKHLLIEKPVTLHPQQADSLLAAARRTGSKIQVGHVERFNAAFEVANRVGAARHIRACRASGYTFRSIDVGVVLDLMIHDIDLACHLAQSEVASVRATGISVFGNHEDIAEARIEFKNGLVANLTASRCSPQPQRQFQVFGNQGYADLDLATGTAKLTQPPEWLQSRQFDPTHCSEDLRDTIKQSLFETIMPVETLEIEPVNAILEEQKNWVHAILDESQSLRVPLADGRRALDIACQIVEAIQLHHWNPEQSIRGPLANPNWLNSTKRTAKVA